MLQAPRNTAPSARANGQQAIKDAIQHHIDRMQPQAEPRMEPAGRGAIASAHAINRANPNTTLFTPQQSRQASSMARRNNPLGVLGNKVEGFLDLKGTAKQAAQMFDPRTRAGLINALSMFVGGGDSPEEVPNTGELSPKDMHDRLFGDEVHAVGPIPRRPGDAPQPPSSTEEVIQSLAKQRNASASDAWDKAAQRAENIRRVGRASGGNLVPYSIRSANAAENRMDTQPRYFKNALSVHGDSLHLQQALWDVIFGGKTAPRPARPGGSNPYGSPYGGGPFG